MEDIIYKDDNTLRICATEGCGGVLTTQRKWCTAKCRGYKKMKSRKLKPYSEFPHWCCPDCKENIEIKFKITGSSTYYKKFDQIKKLHVCLKK